MKSVRPILANVSTSISELQKDPIAVVKSGKGLPVAVLSKNEPIFYCVPAELFEAMMDKLEDVELAALVEARKGQSEIEIALERL